MNIWEISRVLYREILFRSVAQTNVRKRPKDIVKAIDSQMWANKIILALFLSILPFFVATKPTVPNCFVFLAILLFNFVFFFLQTVTTFFSDAFDILHTLPLSPKEVSKVRMLTFLRIFDIPLIAVTIATPLAFGIFVSPISAFWSLLGAVTSELFAITMVVSLARLFYSKVAYSTGGWKTILRMFYMIAWSVSAFFFYFFAFVIEKISNLNFDFRGLNFVFPICFGYLMSGNFSYTALIFSLAYLSMAVFSFGKTLSAINERIVPSSSKAGEVRIKVTHPVIGIFKKDLRLISRCPAHTMMLFLPIIFGIVYATISVSFAIPMVLFTIILVVFTSYGIEREYVKVLPIDFWTLTAGKTLLSVLVYLSAIFCVSVFSRSLNTIGFAQIPSVIAVSVFVSLIMEKLNVRGNVYLEVSHLIFILLPALVIVYLPLLIGLIAKATLKTDMTPISFTMGTIELLTVIGIAKIKKVRTLES